MATAVDLRQQIKVKDELIRSLQAQLEQKEREIQQLKGELDHIRTGIFVQKKRERGIGISAEPQPTKTSKDLRELTFKRHSKSQRTRELINSAIQDNDFLKHLESNYVQRIVSCMHAVEYKKGNRIINEGEDGSLAYVIEEGKVEVTKGSEKMTELSNGAVFGELAMLYNCTRTASVRAMTDCRLWAIDRNEYQTIMTCSAIMLQQQYVEFLKSVPALKDLKEETLNNIADLLEQVHYENGEYIIRKGAKGDTFFIISKGEVKVTDFEPGRSEKILKTGACFGERALETEDVRSANIYACHPDGVDCLVLEREAYKRLIGRIKAADARSGSMTSSLGALTLSPSTKLSGLDESLSNAKLSDFKIIATLGVGGFGRVELVQLGADKKKTFALKQMKKKYIVDTHQQEHVMNEKRILLEAKCDFIVRLYRTYRDAKYLYLLSEACLGGELWTLLRDKGPFNDTQTRFYVACVVEALSYLHSRAVVYRDLKPENLLLDVNGYVKLVDFGFAKHIGHKGQKTWTFCGTPEYVAPEVILNRGHDFAADLWSLGILIYELLNGSPPFSGQDHMKTYNLILKGIDTVEFTKRIGRNAKQLIRKLCRELPMERLGYGLKGLKELQKNKWFDGFNWEGLRKRSLKAPVIPIVKGAGDVSNFDSFPTDDDQPPDVEEDWDRDF